MSLIWEVVPVFRLQNAENCLKVSLEMTYHVVTIALQRNGSCIWLFLSSPNKKY